jgi:hypothetical protein
MAAIPASVAAASAEDAAAPEGAEGSRSSLEKVLTKAVAFETVSSAGETGLFMAFYGTAAVSGPTIFAVSLATATALYVGHELAWEQAASDQIAAGDPETLATKAGSYRVLSTLRSFAVGALLGGADLAASVAFAASVAAVDTALYVANDLAFAWFDQQDAALVEASPAAPDGTPPGEP